MTKRELIEAYQRLSDKDRRVFHRWLVGNIVVGTISVIGLIAITIVTHTSNHSTAAIEATAGLTDQQHPASRYR
jgi:hypothetical protein